MLFDGFRTISSKKQVFKTLGTSQRVSEDEQTVAYNWLHEHFYTSVSCKTYTGDNIIDLLSSIVPRGYGIRRRSFAFWYVKDIYSNTVFDKQCETYGDYHLSRIFDHVRVFKNMFGPVICVSPYVPKDFKVETQKCLNALCAFFCLKCEQLPFSFYGPSTCSILFAFDADRKEDEFLDLMCRGLTIKDEKPKE